MKNYLIIVTLLLSSTIVAQKGKPPKDGSGGGSGGGSTPSPTGTVTNKSISVNGTTRSFLIYIPAMYNSNNPVPLLFNFHGYGLKNTDQLTYGDFRLIADTANFIMVLPQALVNGKGATAKTRWETFDAGPNARDMDFINVLVTYMAGNYNIDQNRVYSTGMSNGGFMSYDLAAFNTRFAAIASVAGDMITTHLDAAAPQHRTPIMEIHGDADQTVPWAGTTIAAAGVTYSPIDALLSKWVSLENCSSSYVKTSYPNTVATDNCTVERYEYSNTEGGKVVLLKVVGGGHTWPGATTTIGGGSGNTNMDINASLEIWKFLRPYTLANPKSLANTEATEEMELSGVNVFPNPTSAEITISIYGELTITSIQLVNVVGVVTTQYPSLNSQKVTIECNEIASGTYFAVIKLSNGDLITKKVIIL